jgi:hypothetical protein
VGHASRSSSLLHLEASQARDSQFASNLAGERQRVVHIASSQRSREDEVKDGWVDAMSYIGLFYPNFAIFIVLGPRGIVVFWLGGRAMSSVWQSCNHVWSLMEKSGFVSSFAPLIFLLKIHFVFCSYSGSSP